MAPGNPRRPEWLGLDQWSHLYRFAIPRMDDREPHTVGQVLVPKDEADLTAILTQRFPQTQLRESCHYSTGKYVRIDFPPDLEFYFERISDEEYLIRGEGGDSQSLGTASAEIAIRFGQLGLRCRFETYDRDDSLIAYAHSDWPLHGKSEANKRMQATGLPPAHDS